MVKNIIKIALIILLLACGYLSAVKLWDHYMIKPWTRDARLRNNVIGIASYLNAKVDSVYVKENQFVHKGDTLFSVDKRDYINAYKEAQRTLAVLNEERNQAQSEYNRRVELPKGLVSKEELDQKSFNLSIAKSKYSQQLTKVEKAQIALSRIATLATVDGYITNISSFKGSYIKVGQQIMSLIDANGFYFYGYFMETQLANITPGDRAIIKLMAYPDQMIYGEVINVARGIADYSNTSSSGSLHKVDPTYEWARLAQRVPVLINITNVPPEVRLTSGLTATIEIENQNDK